MKRAILTTVVALLLFVASASAAPLSITISAAPANQPAPRMGDRLSFHTVIRNDGATPADGVIAWISLIEVDEGKEQPVDLEDWSAHKAVTVRSLPPGGTLETEWPMRLIQAGHYRVVVSAATRTATELAASPFADFSVIQKPVVESQRVLPVAVGIPALIGVVMVWRHRRQRRGA
jgi:hypothetical protein